VLSSWGYSDKVSSILASLFQSTETSDIITSSLQKKLLEQKEMLLRLLETDGGEAMDATMVAEVKGRLLQSLDAYSAEMVAVLGPSKLDRIARLSQMTS
jgi:hypothetical protein